MGLAGQDGDGVFTDFRGEAPVVCLAQPGGLGSNEGLPKGQRPDHLQHSGQMVGALPLNDNPSLNPARRAGLGKRPGLRP